MSRFTFYATGTWTFACGQALGYYFHAPPWGVIGMAILWTSLALAEARRAKRKR